MKRRLAIRNSIGLTIVALAVFFRHPSQPPSDECAITAIVLAGIALALGFVWAFTEPEKNRRSTSARQ